MNCPKCGLAVEAGAEFCGNCGQPLAGAPGASQSSTGVYQSNPLDLMKASWAAVKVNLATYISLIGVILLAVLVMVGLIALTSAGHGPGQAIGFIASAVLVVAIVLVLAPMTTVLFLEGAKGHHLTVKAAIEESWQYKWRYLGLAAIIALAVLGGLILLIVPGIIFYIWFSLAPYVLVNENLGIIESMKRSRQLVKGHGVEVAGVVLLPVLISSIAQLLPFIGIIISIVASVMLGPIVAVRYLQIKQLKALGAQAPPVHVANYLVIVLAILFTGVGSFANRGERHQIKTDFNLTK